MRELDKRCSYNIQSESAASRQPSIRRKRGQNGGANLKRLVVTKQAIQVFIGSPKIRHDYYERCIQRAHIALRCQWRWLSIGRMSFEAMRAFPQRRLHKLGQRWFGRILADVITEQRKSVKSNIPDLSSEGLELRIPLLDVRTTFGNLWCYGSHCALDGFLL